MFTIFPGMAKRPSVHVCQLTVSFVCFFIGQFSMAANELPGKLFEVNAHQMHMHCSGSGSPVVVLEAGLGGSSLEWTGVQRRLSSFTRVCSYDRPGYGWSEMTTAPRDAQTMARELKTLLEAGEESGPYVLVGHSLGGHIVRLFANDYPADVAGLVLVDASHEKMFEYLRDYSSSKDGQKKRVVTRSAMPTNRVPDNFPQQFRSLAIEQMVRLQTQFAIQSEMRQFQRSASKVLEIAEHPQVPVTVISRKPNPGAETGGNGLIAGKWEEMQKDLQNRLANSDHVIAEESGHYPHLDQPELVTSTILSQVERLNQIRISKL